MANENCLAGMACPRCGSLEPFSIAGTALFEVHDDGTEDYGDVEWDDDSSCECRRCGFWENVRAFKIKEGAGDS